MVKFSIFVLVAIVLLAGVTGWAQDSRISGTVTDTSGGVIPGVDVTVTNLDTGVARQDVTNDTGHYSIPQLFTGKYRVAAGMAGFDTQQLELLLDPGQTTEQNFQLSVGALSNVVEVNATSARINVTPYDMATVIEEKQVEQLPLLNRNVLALAALVPGIIKGSQAGRGEKTEDGFRSGGLAMEHVAISLDGIDNTGRVVFGPLATQSQAAKPPPEAIAEFKVITNNTSAEYGAKAGATILISTKGGTNDFHGGIYEFHRNAAVSANNFMFNRDAPRDSNGDIISTPPPYIRNQFGGTFGGPIIADRTFFFFSFQGQRLRSAGRSFLRRVPTSLELAGDFSQSNCAAQGRCANIYDPNTLTGSGQAAERQQFPGNVVPSNRIDPVAQSVMGIYPAPNIVTTSQNNFFYIQGQLDDSELYDIRIDHNFSDNHRIFGRYSYRNEDRINGVNNSLPFPARSRNFSEFRTKQFALNYNATLSSTIHNEFRGGFSQFPASRTDERTENENAKYGIPNAAVEQYPEFAKDPKHQVGLVFFVPTGYDRIGGGAGGGTFSGRLDTITIADNLLWDVGKHSLKFGVEYRRWDNLRSQIFNNDMGQMSFDGRYTAQFPNSAPSRGATGNSIADALMGNTRLTVNNLPIGEDMNIPYWGFYVQDDWRITPKLTLNLGLRYELFMQPRINLGSGLQNARAIWDTPVLDETSDQIDVRFVEWRLPQSSSDCGCKLDKNDWAPRVGIAYRLTDNTVIRAGAGIYYSENGTAGLESNRYNAGGPIQFNNTVNSNQLPGGFEFPDTAVSKGFQLYEVDLDAPLDEYASNFVGAQPGAANVPEFKETINVSQWFLDIQHQLPWDILMTVGYNGISAHNLPWLGRNFALAADGPGLTRPDQPPRRRLLGRTETNTLQQLRGWAITGDNVLNSNYNAFTFKTEKRFSEGLSFTSSFTWSKGLDYGVSSINEITENFIFGGGGPLSPYAKDLFRNRGRAGLTRDFVYNLSVLYELPAGPGKGRFTSGPLSWVLGGWQLGTVLSMQSGPWGTQVWNPNTQQAGGADRGNLVGNPNLPERERDSTNWWNRSAIEAGPAGEWHNAGRGLIELPGFKNWDFLMSKYFDMPFEGHRLQFRFEAFNFTNTPHLGAPGAAFAGAAINANSTNAARIFFADLPRILQFALKYNF